MARPKSTKPKRDYELRVMLTKEEKDWLEKYCEQTAQTMSELARSLLRNLRESSIRRDEIRNKLGDPR
ncbi:MAG: hypothetical protein AB1489_40960 [Acidobacteriota bacterium]